MVSNPESPRVTTYSGINQEDEEKKKVKKKRRQQKTEQQKIENNLIENGEREELGFGSISSENIHGPGYSTFDQNVDKIENRSNSIKLCYSILVISFVFTVLR